MKRVLFHVPAVIAGLLLGSLLSTWLGPATAQAPPKARPAKVAEREKGWPSAPGNLAAFEKLVNSRHAAPEVPSDQLVVIMRLSEILQANAQTPVRSVLESEVFRNALPADVQSGSYVMVFNPDGSPGAAQMAARWTRKYPRYALGEVSRQYSMSRKTEEETNVRLGLVFREWLQNDPRDALEAAANTSSIYTRGQNIRSLMNEWSQLDPAAASAALTNLPEGGPGFERKDFAAILYRHWSASDPAAAQAWVQTQPDPALREILLSETKK